MKRNFYTDPRPKEDSLDFGELDELLDDIDCYNINLHFKDKKLNNVTAYCEGGINDHIISKMQSLYNLRISVIDPANENTLKLFFYYDGDYLNKAEYRKQLEKEKESCGGWIYSGKDVGKWKIKKGMHKKYKELIKELERYA